MTHDLLATTLGGNVPAFSCTLGRHALGISPVNVNRTWQISDLTSGIPQVSESSRHLWATTISWRASSRDGLQRSGNCGTPSHQSQTCNACGKCSSSAQGPRCHHLLRTVPPRQCAGYAHGHDSGMQRTMEALLGRSQEARRRSRWHASVEVRREDGARCILGLMG